MRSGSEDTHTESELPNGRGGTPVGWRRAGDPPGRFAIWRRGLSASRFAGLESYLEADGYCIEFTIEFQK